MEKQLCEICRERPGEDNSRYQFSSDEYDEGDWVCGQCEEELEAECEARMEADEIPNIRAKGGTK